jgi:hypothetical protein
MPISKSCLHISNTMKQLCTSEILPFYSRFGEFLSGLKIFINIFKPDKFLHNSPQNFGDNFVDYFSWQFCGSFCKEKTVNFCQVWKYL